jgi:hypothetical protein
MSDYSDLVRRLRDTASPRDALAAADAIEQLQAALDAARAENESFYQAGFDTGVKLQHGLSQGPKLLAVETMVQPLTVVTCRKCGKPIEAGWFRFGSDEAGWEHMQGECPAL